MSLLPFKVYQVRRRRTGLEPPTIETLIAAFLLKGDAELFARAEPHAESVTYEIREEDDAT